MVFSTKVVRKSPTMTTQPCFCPPCSALPNRRCEFLLELNYSNTMHLPAAAATVFQTSTLECNVDSLVRTRNRVVIRIPLDILSLGYLVGSCWPLTGDHSVSIRLSEVRDGKQVAWFCDRRGVASFKSKFILGSGSHPGAERSEDKSTVATCVVDRKNNTVAPVVTVQDASAT